MMILKKVVHILIFGLLMITGSSLRAQTIWTEPGLPTANEPVTVYFDATETGVEGYTGELYAHTGVNTSEADWQYVIGDWGDNSVQPQLERIDTDLYKLEITPDVYSFYSVPESETIIGLAFVFRTDDASSQSADLFVDIYQSGLNVTFTAPQNNPLLLEGAQLDVSVQATGADSVLLEINGEIVKRVAGNSLDYSFSAFGDNDKTWMVAMAKDAEDMAYDSLYYQIRPEVTTAELPSGMKKGVNYIDNNTVTFVLQAPFKEFVYVIGDFNNWEINNDYYMNLDPDGEHFWLTVDGLSAGQEYIFQFFIDGEIKIADPYTNQTSDPWNDQYISSDIYPGLIAYPDNDMVEGVASVLQTAQEPYEWEVEDFTPPKKEDLVIYELHIRDFVENNTYATITDTLDYLKSLGINALELMPVNEFEGNSSWGYNPSFYFAADKAYGPGHELKNLIDEAHKKGIAVFGDMVLNHSYGLSPLVQMYSNGGQPTSENPWYNMECPHPPNCWGHDFNHESAYTQEFVDSVNAHWMEQYNLDGIRFDFTKGFTNNGDVGYDTDRIQILKRMADEIWEVDPDFYVILEHWADENEEEILVDYGMLVWSNQSYQYNEGVMGWNENGKSDFSWASYKTRGWDIPGAIVYLESHDEERLMFKAQEYGNQNNPEYDVRDLDVALERAGLAAAFLVAIPGPKMIWQFGELGYDVSIDYDCRVCPKPVLWEYYDDYRRKYLFDVYSALIDLKIEYDVFETNDFSIDVDEAMKHVNLNGDNMDAVIIGNFDVYPGEITPQFSQTGTWYDYITGDSLEVNSTDQPVTLQPGEYRIYTSEKIAPSGLSVSIDEYGEPFESSIYPNPSSDHFNIGFELNNGSSVQVKVFDVYGREVVQLLNSKLEAGGHELMWKPEASNPTGVYIIEITSGNRAMTKKVLYK